MPHRINYYSSWVTTSHTRNTCPGRNAPYLGVLGDPGIRVWAGVLNAYWGLGNERNACMRGWGLEVAWMHVYAVGLGKAD